MDQRLDCLKIAYEILKPRINNLSFDDFKSQLKEFEVIPVEMDSELVGSILRKGSELHALVIDKARKLWFNKKTLKIIKETMDKYGFITTKVNNDYDMGHEFALRMGFKVDKIESGITHYIKVKPCQE